jgi:hypothetical protein
MSQMSLPLDWTRGGDEALLLGEANAGAVAALERWRQWPSHCCLLAGPPRSGRSTLAALFARHSGGAVIDDADRAGEADVFHAWNRAQADGRALLLVVAAPPPGWAISLPDLASRIAAADRAVIEPPDLVLGAALIERGLARAGARWSADVPAFVAHRIERSYEAVGAAAAHLAAATVGSGRRITTAFAKEVLHRAGLLVI